MDKNEILKFCKQVITEEVEKAAFKVIKIILFGSRAREDERPDSDWDFYVVVDKQMDFKIKQNISMNIRRRLSKDYISADILMNSFNDLESRRNDTGYISFYAIKEGKIL